MLNYEHLLSLAAVARHGSFEAAARELKVTPSAVSQRVKLLEERTGSLLIVRGQRCTPTVSGALLCRHVERVRFLEVELGDTFSQQASNEETWLPLRVAVNHDSVGSWFVDSVAAICEARRIVIEVVVDEAERTLQWIREGSVQGAVSSHAQPIAGCRAMPLGGIDYVAVCAPSFAQRYFARGVDRRSLALAPRVDLSGDAALAQQFIRSVTQASIDAPVHRIPNVAGVLAACLHAMAWSVLPLPVAGPHLASGALVRIGPPKPAKPLRLALHWHSWDVAIRALDEFGDALRAAFTR